MLYDCHCWYYYDSMFHLCVLLYGSLCCRLLMGYILGLLSIGLMLLCAGRVDYWEWDMRMMCYWGLMGFLYCLSCWWNCYRVVSFYYLRTLLRFFFSSWPIIFYAASYLMRDLSWRIGLGSCMRTYSICISNVFIAYLLAWLGSMNLFVYSLLCLCLFIRVRAMFGYAHWGEVYKEQWDRWDPNSSLQVPMLIIWLW